MTQPRKKQKIKSGVDSDEQVFSTQYYAWASFEDGSVFLEGKFRWFKFWAEHDRKHLVEKLEKQA